MFEHYKSVESWFQLVVSNQLKRKIDGQFGYILQTGSILRYLDIQMRMLQFARFYVKLCSFYSKVLLYSSTCVRVLVYTWVLEYSGSQFCNLDCAKNADWEGWSQAGLQGQMDSLAAKHSCKKYPENIQKTTQFRVRWHILRFAFTFKSSAYIWIHCVGLAKNAELKGWDKSMSRIDSGDFF